MGDPTRRTRSGIVVIPRTPEVAAAEEALSFALVGIVGQNRPQVSIANVSAQLQEFYHLDPSEFAVSTYAPKDFLVHF